MFKTTQYVYSKPTAHLSDDDLRFHFREAFQIRVTDGSWTLGDEEAHALLATFHPGNLLQALTVVGAKIRFLQERDAKIFSEEETVDLVREEAQQITDGKMITPCTRYNLRQSFKRLPNSAFAYAYR